MSQDMYTKSSGKCNMLMLSTTNPILGVSKDDGKQKLVIIKFNDYTKGRTEIDQKTGKYSVKSNSSKGTIAVFSYNTDAFMYGCKLAMFLIQPQLHHLHIFSNGLQIYAQNAIAEHLGLKIERPRAPPGTKKHCQTCLEQIESVHQKKEKNYFGRTVHRCIK